MIKVGKISEKCDILTVEEKRMALIGNKTKRSLEMTPGQRELETRWLKASSMSIKKLIEKIYIVRYWWGKYVEGSYN